MCVCVCVCVSVSVSVCESVVFSTGKNTESLTSTIPAVTENYSLSKLSKKYEPK